MKALLLALPALLLASCASQREMNRNEEVLGGSKRTSNALNSDYLVRSGSVMEVGFSKDSRYFVESGGELRGFGQGVRKSQVFAEKGALIPESLRSKALRRQSASSRSRTPPRASPSATPHAEGRPPRRPPPLRPALLRLGVV